MLARFLAESIDVAASAARLSADEARHLAQVLRLGVGDEIAVFDGAGREFRAHVRRIDRHGADVTLLEEIAAAEEPAVRITLAQAVLKGEKMDDVVRDATMMGVAAIEPLVTEHTAARMTIGRAPERWRRIAIASAKQCRRAVIPAIGSGVAFSDWLVSDQSALKILLTEPSAAAAGKRGQDPPLAEKRDLSPFSALQKRGQVPFSVSLLVGPEGGWSAAEIEAAQKAGYEPVTLGRRTLRADAVPIVAIGILQFVLGDL